MVGAVQVRVPAGELPQVLQDLSHERTSWEAIQKLYPAQEAAPAAAS